MTDPDITKFDYITSEQGQLSNCKGDQLNITRTSETGDWVEGTNRSRNGDTGCLPRYYKYIVKLDSLEKLSWFFGNITRAEAELCLESSINGSFLIHERKNKPGQFCVSLRYDGQMKHYRIHSDPVTNQYYITPKSKFDTLTELVKHHSKSPDGLPTTLSYPAPKSHKRPVYGVSHDFDEWEFDRSNLEMGQKLREGQYHKVHKAVIKGCDVIVAVKSFKVSDQLILSSICLLL